MKLPIEGEITSGYGVRKDPISGETKFHYGIDIGAEKGTDILSNVIGSILFAGKKGNYGNLVIVRSGDVDQYFGHLDTIAVKQGQKVKLGDLLGEVGSTGYSTGNHLHWEIKKDGKNVNPLEFNMTFFDTVSQFFNDIFTPETSQESIFDVSFGTGYFGRRKAAPE